MAQKTSHTPEQAEKLVFGKKNYQLLLMSIAVVIIGFVLMAGDKDIYNTTKTVIAPIVVLAGFGLGFVAIFKKN